MGHSYPGTLYLLFKFLTMDSQSNLLSSCLNPVMV